MTCADLIKASLKRINAIQANETPSAEDQSDAFLRLNDLVDAWQTERLTIFTVTRTTFTITSGTQNYAVGGARPTFLDHVNYIQDTTATVPVELPLPLLTDDQYAAWPNKTLTSVYPYVSYYNPTYPTGTLTLLPTPTGTTLQGVIYAPNAVQQFATTADVISMPPGYQRALRDNLAVELWTEFRENVPIDPTLVQSARESKADMKRLNTRMLDIVLNQSLMGYGRYDLNSDVVFVR